MNAPSQMVYPLRQPVLADDQYRWAYLKGWAASSRGSDLDRAEGNFRRLSPTPAQEDAWMDGWLDVATGRDKWHLRDCTNHDNGPEGCGLA